MGEGVVIGIDLGVRSLKVVAIDTKREQIQQKTYHVHQGDHQSALMEIIGRFITRKSPTLAFTGSVTNKDLPLTAIHKVDLVHALILGVRKTSPQVQNIIDVGASSITLVELNDKGEFVNLSSNNLCAAGTGSFLDSQAARLGLEPCTMFLEQLDRDPPPIATRCAVFAKSDLIHRQQEGYNRFEMWSGLCKGMTGTLLSTLLKGKPLRGSTALTGGVSQNPWFVYWLKQRLGDQLVVIEDGHLVAALGAALDACMNGQLSQRTPFIADWLSRVSGIQKKEEVPLRESHLRLVKSRYPEKDQDELLCDPAGNEICIFDFSRLSASQEMEALIGIDVGSTSTKLCVIDRDGQMLVHAYRKTEGIPVAATQKLLQALGRIETQRGISFKILGSATTGSGRRLVGQIVGADVVINEITAHAQAAQWMDSNVETIFEIGGQDAKYISLSDGAVVDANLNLVCAAGTGSFLEEQADRLGVRVEDIDKLTLGIRPPYSSDRCTVFMEQDIDRLLTQGFSPNECLAAAVFSVAENYLNKVVGNRPISKKKVVFQGATARNKALVAAFERLLGVEVVVSPHCHVMGAFGAALRVREQVLVESPRTSFRGLNLGQKAIQYGHEVCHLCANRCRITFAQIEGEKESLSWGYRCGREPNVKRKKEWRTFDLYGRRARVRSVEKQTGDGGDRATIGLPLCLANSSDYPLWQRFFEVLGYNTSLSPPSDQNSLIRGTSIAGADFCLPVKLALGHVSRLMESERVDYVFLPHVIGDEEGFGETNSYYCPLVQGFPSLARNALRLNGIPTEKLLTAVVDPRLSSRYFFRTLSSELGPGLDRDERAVRKAWEEGVLAKKRFQVECQEHGRKWISDLNERGETGIVIVGRPYNLFDFLINLDIPQRIASLGVPVLPMDHIPNDPPLGHSYKNMYWSYGQKILQSLIWIRQEGLYAVCFTNFGCGPDSFLLSYAEHEMQGRPFLILEFDEYSSDVGYLTRIEAFLDTLRHKRKPPKTRQYQSSPTPHTADIYFPRNDRNALRGRKIWIPPLSPAGSRLFAASFRAHGYDCEALPTETDADYSIGRTLTRGSECLPLVTTTGVLVRKLRELKADPREHAFFMATASGPCRFGQYALLQRMILNRVGYEDLPILSPSSQNSYQGLDEALRRRLYEAFIVSDILTKCLHRTRPYELKKGEADQCLEKSLRDLELAFESEDNLEGAVAEKVQAFERIPIRPDRRPIVGIVGEIYIRCNSFCNEDLVRRIEDFGYEAWLAPALEWMLYCTALEHWNFKVRRRKILPWIKSLIKNYVLERSEHRLYHQALPFLEDRLEPSIESILSEGEKEIPLNFQGETILTIGRTSLFASDGAHAIVNCLPFGCMPGTLTSALFQCLQERLGVPVLNFAYDGKGGVNNRLGLFLRTRTFFSQDRGR